MSEKIKKKKGLFVEILLIGLAVITAIYFVGLVSYIGFYSKFSYIWIFISITCMVCAFVIRIIYVKDIAVPYWLRLIIKLGIICGVLVFAIIEGIIITNAATGPEKGADYVLVLGAKVNGTVPSKSLMLRINAAYDYLVDNEAAAAIVCGGKGADEGISEAEAMKRALVSKGIDESRIIMEDRSVNTEENIRFAMEYIRSSDSKIVVTTNSYHVYRAVAIAKKAGLTNVGGNPAGCVTGLIPQDFTREFFAVIKDWLVGNI